MEPKEIIIPLCKWKDVYRWPTYHGMRMRYRYRKEFGFESAFFKERRMVMIKVNEFWRCLEARGEK